MLKKLNWNRFLFRAGVVGVFLGGVDLMEGSVVIVIGSVLIAIATYRMGDRHSHLFRTTAILIFIGVLLLFLFSSMGGFGKGSSLSWWWAALVLPYPIGWVANIVILFYRFLEGWRKKRR